MIVQNKTSLLTTIFFLVSSVCYCQIKIQGIVTDSDSKLAIPYVNIYSPKGDFHTASNLDGSFILLVKELPLNLIFSHVNYGKKEIKWVSQENTSVILTPLTIQLNEVIVKSQNPNQVVANVFQALSTSTEKIYGKGFYRQWTKNDDIYSEIIESFFTTEISTGGISQSKIVQGRYAMKEAKDKGLMTYKNFSVFTTTFPLVQLAERSFIGPLIKDSEKYFDFELSSNLKKDDGGIILVIKFKPKEDVHKPCFEGSLFIDDNYNLVRFKGFIEDKRFNPIAIDEPERISNVRLEVDIFCDNSHKNLLFFENSKVDLFYKYRLSKEKVRDIHTSSFFFLYDTKEDEQTAIGFDKYSQNDYEAIRRSEYDPAFWENLQVLSQTPIEKEIIRQFKKSNSFSKIFQR